MKNSLIKKNWFMLGHSMVWFDEAYRFGTANPYLFLKRELTLIPENWQVGKENGTIRHCKVLRNGKFFDYIVKREFNTLEEWLADAKDTMDNVMYGVNRVHTQEYVRTADGKWIDQRGTPRYVPLKDVLAKLGYVEPPKVEIPAVAVATRRLTEILDLEMQMRNLTVDNVYVLEGNGFVPWKTFMAE